MSADKVVYLCEMFAGLPVEEIQRQVAEVEAMKINDHRAMEILVDRCIHTSAKESKANGQDKSVQDPEVYEMISLVPPSLNTSIDDSIAKRAKFDADEKLSFDKETDGNKKTDFLDLTREEIPTSKPERMEEEEKTLNIPATRTTKERIDAMVETILQLNSTRGESAVSAWKLLARIGENVVSAPKNPKFRRVPLNEKVSRKLGFLEGSIELCNAIGFKVINAGGEKRYLLLSDDDTNINIIKYAVAVFKAAGISQSSSSSGQIPASTTTGPAAPKKLSLKAGEGIYKRMDKIPKNKISKDLHQKIDRQKKHAHMENLYRKPRLTRERMANLVMQRLNGEKKPADGKIRKGQVTDFNKVQKMKAQIEQVRASKNRKWQNTRMGRKRVYTVSDLEKMGEQRQKAVSNFGKKQELDKVGKEALKYTNEFRAKNGKSPLSWHQALCDIGRVHSKDMGDGKVPFSHTGFKERVAKYPFRHYAAAENLAMNAGIPEARVARVAVNGWIDSPGHRKNLLSDQTLCGIGVYRNHRGQYYLTQLFART